MTLLRVFLLASALIVALGGVVLSSVLTRALSAQAIADNRIGVSQYVDGVLRAELVHGDRLRVTGTSPGGCSASSGATGRS